MRVFCKLMYKDFLVLIRDRGGLAMLFIMPMALVIIMTCLQNNTFKAINETGIKLIILNNDNDSLGTAIEDEIVRSGVFNVFHQINNQLPNEKTIKEEVARGNFQIGMIIPPGSTQKIRERVKNNVINMFSGSTDTVPQTDSVNIIFYIDPATKSSLRSTLQGSIREYTSRIESKIVLNELTREINTRLMVPVKNLNLVNQEIVHYKEQYVARNNRTVVPNSVQHNVPAWTLFAMFFIVIPFASAMIKENEDGNTARLLTMPCSYTTIMLSRTVLYLMVCFLQFILIMVMGVYLFPMIGLPALEIENRLTGLSVLAVSASLAAIGYGVLIGTVAKTHQQAAVFASISVVILAAIGGIWVPVFIMPPLFREISTLSPLNWGLNGFYDILVRNAGIADVMHYGIWMLLFSLGCLVVALYYNRMKKEFS
jgi:ABC-2 type transport system permease protein